MSKIRPPRPPNLPQSSMSQNKYPHHPEHGAVGNSPVSPLGNETDLEEDGVGEGQIGGQLAHKIAQIKRSFTGKDKIDKLKVEIKELQQRLEIAERDKRENQDYRAGIERLRVATEKCPFSTAIHHGPVQYGHGNSMYVLESARGNIEKLTEMINDSLSQIAELQQTADRNEKILKENKETLKTCLTTINDKSQKTAEMTDILERLIEDMSGNQSDEQVFMDGIRAIKDEIVTRGTITDIKNLPVMFDRAIRRTLDKYDSSLDYKQFSELLNKAPKGSLHELKKIPMSDPNTPRLDKENCAQIIIEWSITEDHKPETFVMAAAAIDQLLIKERTTALQKNLIEQNQNERQSEEPIDFTEKPNKIGSEQRGGKENESSEDILQIHHQLNQMANAVELNVVNIVKKMNDMPSTLSNSVAELVSNVEAKQNQMIAMLEVICSQTAHSST